MLSSHGPGEGQTATICINTVRSISFENRQTWYSRCFLTGDIPY